MTYERALEISSLQCLSIRRNASCKKFIELLRRVMLHPSIYNPITKIIGITSRIQTHDNDLRNDQRIDQTLLPVMSERFKNFATRKYY